MCNQNDIKEQLKYEIMKISQTLIKQNYFQFQDTLYIQDLPWMHQLHIFSPKYICNI